MTYTLIGSGNMAWLIASGMQQAGHTCTGVWGRNHEAAAALCEAFSLKLLTSSSQLSDGPDACIVAVADAAIPEVIAALTLKHTTLIHTAGSVPLSMLSGNSLHSGVVWPVYSIRKSALPDHRSFPVMVEANDPQASGIVRQVAGAISDHVLEAGSEQRRWLHLAAVISNNFVNHLLGIAADICADQDLPASLLRPMLEQTISGAAKDHPARYQTGPARRHDQVTMDRHLSLMSDHPDWQEIYKTLSNAIMKAHPLPPRG